MEQRMRNCLCVADLGFETVLTRFTHALGAANSYEEAFTTTTELLEMSVVYEETLDGGDIELLNTLTPVT